MTLKVQPRHDLSPAERAAVGEALYAFNVEATGIEDGLDLGFIVEDGGEQVAALVGDTWGATCKIELLWVRADHRGTGLGSRLLTAALDEARARGCTQAILTTHDFQAPGFYRRHGFEAIAEIPDKPKGYVEHIMRLRLG